MLNQKEKIEMIERIENITVMLDRLNEVIDAREDLERLEVVLKLKVKEFMNKKGWERYLDEKNKVGVSIYIKTEEVIDMKQLKFLLKKNDLANITSYQQNEKIEVTTPNQRARLIKLAKGG